jgi:hypothetical protein
MGEVCQGKKRRDIYGGVKFVTPLGLEVRECECAVLTLCSNEVKMDYASEIGFKN